jgi:hypothetical protein
LELLDNVRSVAPVPVEEAERAARRSLKAQIAKLERELSEAFVTAFTHSMGGLTEAGPVPAPAPRLLDLGELERVRDDLAERLRAARVTIAERADAQAASRVELERMLLEPAQHRFTRISCRELGEPGCGVWQVRPRLGLIGMLMGWWQVKLSSGCPLPRGRRALRAGGPFRDRRCSVTCSGPAPERRSSSRSCSSAVSACGSARRCCGYGSAPRSRGRPTQSGLRLPLGSSAR